MLINVLNRFEPFKAWGPRSTKEMVSDSFVGIEVEVESLQDYQGDFVYWVDKEDGSLRNNGREYVTHPIPANLVPYALLELQEFLDDVNPKHSFSTRTSVHVHLNVRDMTFKQLHALSIVYLLFEKAFYKFAGRDRYKNIFCVPHADSIDYATVAKAMEVAGNEDTLTVDDIVSLRSMFENCRRYVGFNVKCVPKYGTVEFRHLPGTIGIVRITTWINLILSLKKYVMENSYEQVLDSILTINTTSQYEQLLSFVFGKHKDDITYPECAKDMYDSLLLLKEVTNAQSVWSMAAEIGSRGVQGSEYTKKISVDKPVKKEKIIKEITGGVP